MGEIPVSLTVDGRPVRTARTRLLIHVLRELGIQVPTLCHDDRLTSYGGCRLCVVERADGSGGLVPACCSRENASRVEGCRMARENVMPKVAANPPGTVSDGWASHGRPIGYREDPD